MAKNNYYKQGTKLLKGDSLFYDRLKGYGRATKHVTFNDDEQKTTIHGDLGVYTKADERTVVTENAYVVLVTEEKDTSKTDTALKPTIVPKPAVDLNKPKNSIPIKKDGLQPPNAFITEKTLITQPADSLKKARPKMKRDSVFMTADTIETRILTFKDLKILQEKQRLSGIRDTSFKIIPSEVYSAAKPVKYYNSTRRQCRPIQAFIIVTFLPKCSRGILPKNRTKQQRPKNSRVWH